SLLFALLALELIFAALGATMVGDGPDLDVEIDLPEIPDLDGFDLDPGEFDLPEVGDGIEGVSVDPGALSWLGIGQMPFVIWLATMCFGFGAGGLILQSVATTLFGAPLPAILAVPPVAVGAILFTRSFGRVFARVLPKTETSSLSERSLSGKRGIVSQGTARADSPAQVRITDRHGNFHFVRVTPLVSDPDIPQGTEVLVVRNRRSGAFHAIVLSD
ncbi:MAG: hypothetical protein ACI9AX_002319, partial [Polaromonas sp.]